MSKGLEKLKTIRHIHDMECGEDESINKDLDIIEQELKALEIIKEKKVNVMLFISLKDIGLERYNKCFEAEEHQLTQEEFDFLKEILL